MFQVGHGNHQYLLLETPCILTGSYAYAHSNMAMVNPHHIYIVSKQKDFPLHPTTMFWCGQESTNSLLATSRKHTSLILSLDAQCSPDFTSIRGSENSRLEISNDVDAHFLQVITPGSRYG